MRQLSRLLLGSVAAIVALTSMNVPVRADESAVTQDWRGDRDQKFRHVLLISVDGFHAVDLQTYVANHPNSALAELSRRGVTYTQALTTGPSDSFPGMIAQATGGTPRSADVFYDVSYDRELYAAGSNCKGDPGIVPPFDESLDKNPLSYTGGGTLGQPLTQLDPAKLPLRIVNGKCELVYPHQFIKVNTLFEVLREHDRYTAWADKHPAYDILNGPSGKGIIDLYTPEVNANDAITGQDSTKGFHSVQRDDALKVKAVLNEIDGKDSTGQHHAPVPAIYGMNFQAVSVGEKLATGNAADPADKGLIGGYLDAAGHHPASGLQSGLDFVDRSLAAIIDELKETHEYKKTLIIVSAKHGQSPINRAVRQAYDDSPYGNVPGIGGYSTDDEALVWLKPKLQKADYEKAEAYIKANATKLGIVQLLDRDELVKYYRDPFTDNRTPDFVALTKHGLIYTGGTKLAEHGGFSADDRHVAMLVSGGGELSDGAHEIADNVETRQIAPTILEALGVNPHELQAVKIERTKTLPGLDLR